MTICGCFLHYTCISVLCVHKCEWKKRKCFGLCKMSQTWIKKSRKRVGCVFILEYQCMLTPSVYSLESSLMQATLIPCQHWCHKWPHFSASYWSIRCDTAFPFDVQLTNSRHCNKWPDLYLTPWSILIFSFSVVCFCPALLNSCCSKRKHPVSHLLIGSDKTSQWCV